MVVGGCLDGSYGGVCMDAFIGGRTNGWRTAFFGF